MKIPLILRKIFTNLTAKKREFPTWIRRVHLYGAYIFNRAGYHMTFVYGNIVSLQMVFAIFFIYLLLIYTNHVPGKQIPIPAVYNFPILLLYCSIDACTNWWHIFLTNKHCIKKIN